MQRQVNHYDKKEKGTEPFSGSAQVYVKAGSPPTTENEQYLNVSSTSVQAGARPSRKELQKAWRNRAREWPPERLLEFLKAHFRYSAARGKLFYRQGPRRGHAVRVSITNGYERTSYQSLEFRVHQVIWMLVNNSTIPPGYEIDHINRRRAKNRDSNLRLVTRGQNQWNAGMRKDNTSGVKGVHIYHGPRGTTYSANISINGKVKYLGAFPTALEAAKVYQDKALELRGEYVPLPPQEVSR